MRIRFLASTLFFSVFYAPDAMALTCEQVQALLENGVPHAEVITTIQLATPPLSADDVACLAAAQVPVDILGAVGVSPMPGLKPQGASRTRILVNTAVTGAGLAFGGAAIYNLTQANEAHADYATANSQGRSVDARTLIDSQVRPRSMVAATEGLAAIGLVTSGVILWSTTNGLDALKVGPVLRRYALSTTLAGVGAGVGYAAIYNLGEARKAALDQAAEADPAKADSLLKNEVRPRQIAAAVEGALAAATLGTALALWSKSDTLSMGVSPTGCSLGIRW